MGMYDQIKDTLFCPFCGEKSNYFQTKDMASMLDCWTINEIIEFYKKGEIIEIYNECEKCKKWISINLDITRLKSTVSESKVKRK